MASFLRCCICSPNSVLDSISKFFNTVNSIASTNPFKECAMCALKYYFLACNRGLCNTSLRLHSNIFNYPHGGEKIKFRTVYIQEKSFRRSNQQKCCRYKRFFYDYNSGNVCVALYIYFVLLSWTDDRLNQEQVHLQKQVIRIFFLNDLVPIECNRNNLE